VRIRVKNLKRRKLNKFHCMSGLPIQVYSMAIKAETTTAGSSGTFRMTARVAPAAANRNIGQRVHVVKVHNMKSRQRKLVKRPEI
jgi:hypothetical protein